MLVAAKDGRLVETNALLDIGANFSIVSESLIQRLEVDVIPATVSMTGINGTQKYKTGKVACLGIFNMERTYGLCIKDLKIVPNWCDDTLPRNMQFLEGKMNIDIVNVKPAIPDLLIGLNHPKIWLWNEHIWCENRYLAIKTLFGWTVSEIRVDNHQEELSLPEDWRKDLLLSTPHCPKSIRTKLNFEYAKDTFTVSKQEPACHILYSNREEASESSYALAAEQDNPDADVNHDAEDEVIVLAATELSEKDVPIKKAPKVRLEREFVDIMASINKQMERWWSAETFEGESSTNSVEEDQCIANMNKSYRNNNGNAVISPLWKKGQPEPGLNNFHYAKSRLLSVHKKLTDKTFGCLDKIFQEYLEGGLIEEVKVDDPYVGDALYWAMFPVSNPNSETTPVRPVMDGAAKCLNGKSINEMCFLKGPNMINDLSKVLTRFRRYNVGLMGDVSKMFLKIQTPEEDRKYYRFLWCDRSGKTIRYFQFTGHLFGNNGSPTVSIFATQKNAQDFKDKYPIAVEIIENSTIVDDHIDSVPTEEEALEVLSQIAEIHKAIGLDLTKCISNSELVAKKFPAKNLSDNMIGFEKYLSTIEYAPGTESKLPQVRTLGQQWDMINDRMTYTAYKIDKNAQWTKAACLSQAHKIFDPLGFLTPVLLQNKLFMQGLWKRETTWKDPITAEEEREWETWLQNLPQLSELYFDRKILPGDPDNFKSVQMHVFCDASKEAHAAVAYIRLEYKDKSKTYTNFIMAKNKVTPHKQNRTIPKLELMGVDLGNRLAHHLATPLKVKPEDIYLWTDSKTAIQWLRMEPGHLQTLAHNLVIRIRKDRDVAHLRWISGTDNPADIPTRPKTVNDLLDRLDLWQKGPSFLTLDMNKWPNLPDLVEKTQLEVMQEVKREYKMYGSKQTCLKLTMDNQRVDGFPKDVLITRLSRYKRLIRTFGYVNRFIDICRGNFQKGPLLRKDLVRAEATLVKSHQFNHFPNERDGLEKNTLALSDPLRAIGAELRDGIIRLTGRLQHAHLDDRAKSPYLLHPDGYLTHLIVGHYHKDILKHTGGIRCLMCEINRSYWIIGSIKSIKLMLKSCVQCRKTTPRIAMPKMAPLPESRIPGKTASVPFSSIGIDAAGPWLTLAGRGKVRQKRWLLIIRCTTYGAIHIEMLYDMTEQSFLNALGRFINRHTTPRLVFCDNGTNFVGGSNQLTKIWSRVQEKKPEMEFTFSPADASHFNGLVERIIGSVKLALKSILRDTVLTDEMLITTTVHVENLLNNRPLAYKNQLSDPKDPEAITPNHFMLRGRVAESLLPPDTNAISSKLHKLKQINELVQLFHHRYVAEILPYLRRYQKWAIGREELRVGDVVVILDEVPLQERLPLGRIEAVEKGTDGVARRFTVKVKQSLYQRGANKIALILPDNHVYPAGDVKVVDGPAMRTRAKKALLQAKLLVHK